MSAFKKTKLKKKIGKLLNNSDSGSDNEDDEPHELFYYANDRVKMMKQVLKIIKPKKIKSMAPECIKHLDIEEINSMLLEELLGISNKRLKYIFNGQNVDDDSSSTTEAEEDKQPIDIISLDDVSDDDFSVIEVDAAGQSKKQKHKPSGSDSTKKRIKKEKDKSKQKSSASTITKEAASTSSAIAPTEENLMSVLELLELQARARAIRSQLAIESNKKQAAQQQKEKQSLSGATMIEDNDDDAVIIQSPKNEEIVISSSDSETENDSQTKTLENTNNIQGNNVETSAASNCETGNTEIASEREEDGIADNNGDVSKPETTTITTVVLIDDRTEQELEKAQNKISNKRIKLIRNRKIRKRRTSENESNEESEKSVTTVTSVEAKEPESTEVDVGEKLEGKTSSNDSESAGKSEVEKTDEDDKSYVEKLSKDEDKNDNIDNDDDMIVINLDENDMME